MASQLPGDVLLEVLNAMHEALDDGHLGGVGGGDLDERADLLLLQVLGDSGMHELSYQPAATKKEKSDGKAKLRKATACALFVLRHGH